MDIQGEYSKEKQAAENKDFYVSLVGGVLYATFIFLACWV